MLPPLPAWVAHVDTVPVPVGMPACWLREDERTRVPDVCNGNGWTVVTVEVGSGRCAVQWLGVLDVSGRRAGRVLRVV